MVVVLLHWAGGPGDVDSFTCVGVELHTSSFYEVRVLMSS